MSDLTSESSWENGTDLADAVYVSGVDAFTGDYCHQEDDGTTTETPVVVLSLTGDHSDLGQVTIQFLIEIDSWTRVNEVAGLAIRSFRMAQASAEGHDQDAFIYEVGRHIDTAHEDLDLDRDRDRDRDREWLEFITGRDEDGPSALDEDPEGKLEDEEDQTDDGHDGPGVVWRT